jgi:hypothetical protein
MIRSVPSRHKSIIMLSFKFQHNKILILCCYLAICSVVSLRAANYTASREIKDSCTIHKGYIINISSKKANIIIHGWDKPMISIRIRIYFENSSIKTAAKELEYAKCNIIKTADGVNLNNYFSLPSDVGKITSTVRVEYIINMPNHLNIIINNDYGNCELHNLNAFINLNNKYGSIELSNIGGLVSIYSTLCSIRADNLRDEIKFVTLNSNYELTNMNGNISITNNVGKIRIQPGSKLRHLSIKAEHCEMELLIKDFDLFNYDLYTKNAKIILGHHSSKQTVLQKSENKLIYYSDPKKAMIEVSTSFNDIKLN